MQPDVASRSCLVVPRLRQVRRQKHSQHYLSDGDFLFSHAQALQRARDLARLHMEKYQRDYAQRYDASHRHTHFIPGDVVWLQALHKQHKLMPNWLGPYRVFQRLSDNIYRIHDVHGIAHPHPVSVEHLKRAFIDQNESYGLPDQPVIFPPVSSMSSSLSDSFSSSSSVLGLSSSSSSSASSSHHLSHPAAPAVTVIPFGSRSIYSSIEPAAFSSGIASSSAAHSAETDDHTEYLVERILDHRDSKKGQVRNVLVKWKDYNTPTWEPRSNLDECRALDEYDLTHKPPDTLRRRLLRVGPSHLALAPPSPVTFKHPSVSFASSSMSSSSTLPQSSSSRSSSSLSSSTTTSLAPRIVFRSFTSPLPQTSASSNSHSIMSSSIYAASSTSFSAPIPTSMSASTSTSASIPLTRASSASIHSDTPSSSILSMSSTSSTSSVMSSSSSSSSAHSSIYQGRLRRHHLPS